MVEQSELDSYLESINLRERVSSIVQNRDLKKFRNRALPNLGDETDEAEVLEFVKKDDNKLFIDQIKSAFNKTPYLD